MRAVLLLMVLALSGCADSPGSATPDEPDEEQEMAWATHQREDLSVSLPAATTCPTSTPPPGFLAGLDGTDHDAFAIAADSDLARTNLTGAATNDGNVVFIFLDADNNSLLTQSVAPGDVVEIDIPEGSATGVMITCQSAGAAGSFESFRLLEG